MGGQQFGVVDGSEGQVAGQIPAEFLVALMQEPHGNRKGKFHHRTFGVILEGK